MQNKATGPPSTPSHPALLTRQLDEVCLISSISTLPPTAALVLLTPAPTSRAMGAVTEQLNPESRCVNVILIALPPTSKTLSNTSVLPSRSHKAAPSPPCFGRPIVPVVDLLNEAVLGPSFVCQWTLRV